MQQFFCLIISIILLPIYAQEGTEDQGIKVMDCEYCSSLNVKMYLKDNQFHLILELSPDILKQDAVSWHKILKKVRESAKYQNLKGTIRFLPFSMPENTSYRPNIYAQLMAGWRENTTLCMVLFKCVFVMSQDVAQNMLWQLRGTSEADKMVIELVLNVPEAGQQFYCFFPLAKNEEQGDEEDVTPNQYMFMTIGKKDSASGEPTSAQEIIEQTEITIDGWVPTPGETNLEGEDEVWIPITRRFGLFDSDDFEKKDGISTLKK